MKKIIFSLFFCATFSLSAQTTDAEINQIVDQLSLEEKVYLVIGTGMDIPGMTEESNAPQAVVGTTKDKVAGAAGTSYTNKNFGFPAVVFADGPAGIRISPVREEFPDETFYATAFPTATSLSSTWNVDLAQEIGSAFGREGKEYGVDFLLAPALNIHRHPLGGRNFEYYSEDPVLAGKITAAFVNGVQAEGIGATIKHFVANNSETNRTELNTVVSERALREIYLKGFKIAVEESNPWAIMSSYNKINGTYASENEELLNNLLREEWGYEGFVMTDWFAGKDPVAQMRAGNDLLMPGTNQQATAIMTAVNNGELPEEILDRNVSNILKQYYKTPSFKDYKPTGKPDLEGNKKIARKAASEGMVLLKNIDKTLPLDQNAKVALFGVTSVETISGGTGSGDVNKAYMVSVTEGFENAGFELDQDLLSKYDAYVKEERAKIPPKEMFFEKDILVPEQTWTTGELETIAENNDVAVFTFGRTSGEFQDRVVEGDFELSEEELQVIRNISNAFRSKNKKFVVLLNIGGVIETQSWKGAADAILLSWQPGQEAGNAIADVVSGKVNPSGKLPVTFPVSINDVASGKNFPGTVLDTTAPKSQNPLAGVPSEEIYEEGIYVGYRYFDSFDVETSFTFGFGLSYTDFEYSDLKVNRDGNEIKLELSVTNSGETAGKEVVQLYVNSPQGSLEKPEKELKAFAKTKNLKSGETEKITLRTDIEDLAYYDPGTNSWKLNAGNYRFIIAGDAQTPKLEEELFLEEKEVKTTQDLFNPEIAIEELTRN